MIKYATAIRTGTASTEAILRRFMKANATHPTYQAMIELGRARILQAALVYVNMLMLQDLLAESEWADVLTAEDQRGLTPLFWPHVLPYGEVKLNMTSRLSLGTT